MSRAARRKQERLLAKAAMRADVMRKQIASDTLRIIASYHRSTRPWRVLWRWLNERVA